MLIPFAERHPTEKEIEQLRLILSTYQDGSGHENRGTLPGYREFERSVAVVFNGQTAESKYLYDVLFPVPHQTETYYGIDCKMRKMLRDLDHKGIVTIEVSNANAAFWNSVKEMGVNEETIANFPNKAGEAIIETIESWHYNESIKGGGKIITDKSSYLILLWNKEMEFQLYQYPVELPDPTTLKWELVGQRLLGCKDGHRLFEWYCFSGGQLKYYPKAGEALWHSKRFRLEPIPPEIADSGLKLKAASYFPDQWQRARRE